MLIIHDNGKIIATMTGTYQNPAAIVADVPAGYAVESVDVETGLPVLVPVAASDDERMAALEKQFAAFVVDKAGDGSNADNAIPFVYGMAVENGKCYSYGGLVYRWTDSNCPACVWLPDSGIWQWVLV